MNESEKIVNYSTTEFLKNGFYKTTMDQLAKGMKISKKTIYKFFPSKTMLLEKVVQKFQKKITSELDLIIESDKSIVEKIKDLGSFFAHFSVIINKKILNDFLKHEPELWQKVDSFRTNVMENIWENLIIEGKREGLIVDKSNQLIMRVILSSIRGVINPEFLTKNNISINDAFEQTFSIIINGILTEKGRIEFEKQEWKK
jgi:AcrR family transcriptional regulator